MDDLNELLSEAVKNAREDRNVTASLLADLIMYLKGNEERFKDVGATAAKYVETLQRSNEQIVKVGSMVYKQDSSLDLTDEEKDKIFDVLQNSNKEDE